MLMGLAIQNMLLVFIGIFGFYTCYRQKQYLQQAGPDYGAGFDNIYETSKPRSPGMIARWLSKRKSEQMQKRFAAERASEKEVDRVLDKVGREGIHSLTEKEKRALQEATERQRDR